MKLTKKQREKVRMKYGGLCAYSGTPLKDDWQVDHVVPIVRNWWDGTCVLPEANEHYQFHGTGIWMSNINPF